MLRVSSANVDPDAKHRGLPRRLVKKEKKNKKCGLRLFEKYYLESPKVRIKEKQVLQECSATEGRIECDD